MDKYEGMNRPIVVLHGIEYPVRERCGHKNAGAQEKHKTKCQTIKSDGRKIFFGIRVAACLVLLFFPLLAGFTNWSTAVSINDFLRHELTREIRQPSLQAEGEEKHEYAELCQLA